MCKYAKYAKYNCGSFVNFHFVRMSPEIHILFLLMILKNKIEWNEMKRKNVEQNLNLHWAFKIDCSKIHKKHLYDLKFVYYTFLVDFSIKMQVMNKLEPIIKWDFIAHWPNIISINLNITQCETIELFIHYFGFHSNSTNIKNGSQDIDLKLLEC